MASSDFSDIHDLSVDGDQQVRYGHNIIRHMFFNPKARISRTGTRTRCKRCKDGGGRARRGKVIVRNSDDSSLVTHCTVDLSSGYSFLRIRGCLLLGGSLRFLYCTVILLLACLVGRWRFAAQVEEEGARAGIEERYGT